ncbi:MAG: glycosyltransferase family 39 protein [Anaerolineae bacterium]|nr:glycosyltransferase family 39 protein [Anaerolineae bacterium]
MKRRQAALCLNVLLLLIGAGLRFQYLVDDEPLHPDEALFATLGRRMVQQQDWLLSDATTDKPPLTYLLVGVSLAGVGQSEFAARLPSVLASLIGAAAFFALIRRLSKHTPTAHLGLLLYILSPVEIAFAPTIFQDTLMLACVLLSAVWATHQKWGWAGALLGLAWVMKPTGLWGLPLVIGIGIFTSPVWSSENATPIPLSRIFGHTKRFILGVLLILVPVLAWDMARPQQSFVTLGGYNNNPGRLVRTDEIGSRAEAWRHLMADAFGGPIIGIAIFSIVVGWLIFTAQKRRPARWISWSIALFLVWYLGLYWLVAFSIRIRYLLPIMPFILLLVILAIGEWASRGQWRVWLSAIGIILLMAHPALRARPLSREPQDFDLQGIDELADTLNRDFAGRIVYDYWLGWELGWYLGEDTDVWLVYFSTPEELAAHLQTETGARYLVTPNEELAQMWVYLLNLKNAQTSPIRYIHNFVIYEVMPPLKSPPE